MYSFIKKHSFITPVIVIIIIILAIFAGRMGSNSNNNENTKTLKQIQLVNASEFRTDKTTISANGVVESHSQVDIKSQTSAPISSIHVSIGEQVYPGQVMIEMENNDIRSQLAQAEAALAIAIGQKNTSVISLESAKQGAIDKVNDAYIKSYDAVITQAEQILLNKDGARGRLLSSSVDQKIDSEITDLYIDLKNYFPKWKNITSSLDSSDSTETILNAIKVSEQQISKINTLLNDMSIILNNMNDYVTPVLLSSLNTWKGIVSGEKVAISLTSQSLTAAKLSLLSANESESSVSRAQVNSAYAGVDALKAQYNKTIIRSPIKGKVSSLPLREGEYASPGILIASIIGNQTGLILKVYISGDDLNRISTGALVTIQNRVNNDNREITGKVSNIAPGIDSITKKAEVIIEIDDPDNSNLIVGQNISVLIKTTGNSLVDTNKVTYLLPIQNVKIIPGSAFVYTLDSNSKIVRNDVILGNVKGEYVEVKQGITDDMKIVSPVYELDEGQEVKPQ